MKSLARWAGIGAALSIMAGCDPKQQTEAVSSLAGAVVGAGVGAAVSAEKDKKEGALIGMGAGAIVGGILSSQE